MTTQDATLAERLSRLEGGYDHLATKEDLARIEGKLDASLARIEGKLDASLARTEATMTEAKADIIKWGAALMVGLTAIAGSLAFAMARLTS